MLENAAIHQPVSYYAFLARCQVIFTVTWSPDLIIPAMAYGGFMPKSVIFSGVCVMIVSASLLANLCRASDSRRRGPGNGELADGIIMVFLIVLLWRRLQVGVRRT